MEVDLADVAIVRALEPKARALVKTQMGPRYSDPRMRKLSKRIEAGLAEVERLKKLFEALKKA